MIIKKYKGSTEEEALEKVREDLGPNAIVLHTKKIKPSLLARLFRKKEIVEITASIDDNTNIMQTPENAQTKPDTGYKFGQGFEKSREEYAPDAANAIEEKINTIAKLLEQQMVLNQEIAAQTEKAEPREDNREEKNEIKAEKETEQLKSKNKVVELILNQLIENEVSEKYANSIIKELDYQNENQPLENILSNTYQKIVLKLGEIKPLTVSENKPKIVFFVGNTGVGKTTTMAKLASKFCLEKKMNIAMLSVDTYRIAAIEQIKTYANILSTPMEVVYTPEDMKNYAEKYKSCDLIFVDTAGRSHKNEEQRRDLNAIIESVSDYEKEIFLVVSVTTKYNDLLSIANTYKEMFDYKLIFTKLDETKGIGSILNLKLDTGKALSYVTWGQNVPDDIGEVNPQVITRELIGGGK